MMSFSGRKQQAGSFLLIVMVFILVMTFSGLFVMEIAMLEEVTTGNEQHRLQVYQVAYSELEAQLSSIEKDQTILVNALNANQTLTPIVNPGNGINQSVSLSYIGVSTTPAGSSNNLKAHAFEINSVATLASTGAESDQSLGFVYVTSN